LDENGQPHLTVTKSEAAAHLRKKSRDKRLPASLRRDLKRSAYNLSKLARKDVRPPTPTNS
jgi:hypothetical protein